MVKDSPILSKYWKLTISVIVQRQTGRENVLLRWLNLRLSDILSDRSNSSHAIFQNNVELLLQIKLLPGLTFFRFCHQVDQLEVVILC